jgi:hypothetical protein
LKDMSPRFQSKIRHPKSKIDRGVSRN